MKFPVVVLLVVKTICALGTQVLPWGADVPVHRGSVESFDIGASPTGNLVAAQYVPTLNEIRVFGSKDYGDS